ncbi:DUF2849 domain-containing protein [Aquisediminimonas sediminicola]|uniref:DUF2849 domain-containing protein n=1 Tax=Alteraquisediminimonas sediminicola TaxID=2676787 RepID=UPI001C8D6716
MKILTGNDLKTGDVIWWTGKSWSRHIGEAVDAGDNGEAVLAEESAAQRVNAAYIVDAAASPNGPLPLHIKDRVRAAGPTVRADLGINPDVPIVKG